MLSLNCLRSDPSSVFLMSPQGHCVGGEHLSDGTLRGWLFFSMSERQRNHCEFIFLIFLKSTHLLRSTSHCLTTLSRTLKVMVPPFRFQLSFELGRASEPLVQLKISNIMQVKRPKLYKTVCLDQGWINWKQSFVVVSKVNWELLMM